jgi:glyoxylase-like metal-dependent hydrolase (beta-lactamase superfamily II)
VVATDDGVYAIDVGMDSEAADFLEGLQTIGVDPRALTAVFLTHWHNDHSAGASFLKDKFGASIYYADAEKPFLTRETARHGLRTWLGERVPEEGPLVLLRGLLEEAAPAAVVADHHVRDGEKLPGGFRAIASQGHTPGHVAYFHEPTRALFCGDALAVINDQLRLMARPVTPDLPAARAAALRCLAEDAQCICPGHRGPLTTNVAEERARLRAQLESGAPWPLFG